jgi:phosphoribosyl 1,2-cyclic phosphodiesterase
MPDRDSCNNHGENRPMMTIKFWGVRGSIAVPGPQTVAFGGNTSCVSAEIDDRIIIFDCGTGVRECGSYLLARYKKDISGRIFISHTHWDHIQGFPFFVPSYIPGNNFTMHGPASDLRNLSLKQIMAMQTNYEYFPVRIGQLGATLNFIDCIEGKIVETAEEPYEVHTFRLNHPVACFAYKLVHNGKTYIYGGDHEPYRNPYEGNNGNNDIGESMMKELYRNAEEQNQKIDEFCRGADLVSWDSQYSAEEYQSKKGWGHSWCEYNFDFAQRCSIRHFICTHHDPLSSDSKLSELEKKYSAMAAKKGFKLEFAREGMEITL